VILMVGSGNGSMVALHIMDNPQTDPEVGMHALMKHLEQLELMNNVVKLVSGKNSPGSRKQRFVKLGKTSAKNRQT
jgi:hypothetical protein